MQAGCSAVIAPPAVLTPKVGIDAASPLAAAVLLQECMNAGCTLAPIDAMTGAPLPGHTPLDLDRYALTAFAPDGRTLAAITYEDNNTLAGGRLTLVDLATWQPTSTVLTFDQAAWLLFSPDGRRLLVGAWDRQMNPTALHLTLVDLAHLAVVANGSVPFLPRTVAFIPGGDGLMVYGGEQWEYATTSAARSHVALLDADLQIEWQQTLDGVRDGIVWEAGADRPEETATSYAPAVVAAPDRPLLYLVHADADRLTTVDFGAQRVATTTVGPQLSWVEWLLALTARPAYAKVGNGISKQAVLSPDGRYLYVAGTSYDSGEGEVQMVPQGLQVIEVATGVEVARLDSDAEWLAVDPAGRRLFLQGWTRAPGRSGPAAWTEIVAIEDAGRLAPLARLEGYHVVPGRRLDGRPVLAGYQIMPDGANLPALFDPASLEHLHTAQTAGSWLMP
jgi:hypothetical protein